MTAGAFRQHFKRYGYLYPVVILPLLLAGVYTLRGDSWEMKSHDRAREVASWPEQDGRVVNSVVHEVDLPGETSGSGRITVNARISFVRDGETVVRDYAASWERRDTRDWEAFFALGNGIRIRVSPERTGRISLIDQNGVP